MSCWPILTFILDDAANNPLYCVLIHVIVFSWRMKEVGKEAGNESALGEHDLMAPWVIAQDISLYLCAFMHWARKCKRRNGFPRLL